MTNVEKVLVLLRSSPRGLTDAEIGRVTGIAPHAQVNQICNRLARRGLTSRIRGTEGHFVNRALAPRAAPSESRLPVSAASQERPERALPGGSLGIELASTLFVIPCSADKRRGGAIGGDGGSVLDDLPAGLAAELRAVREKNAASSQLDESRRMAAVERYNGLLYRTAAGAFERLERAGVHLAVVSGGYGLVLGRETIGWYDRVFVESRWPRQLVSRCLGRYAEAARASTVVGLFGRTTAYAKAFRRVSWGPTVKEVWLVTPLAEDVPLRKVPRAIGEALAALSTTGVLVDGWTSSEGAPLSISSLRPVAAVEASSRRQGR